MQSDNFFKINPDVKPGTLPTDESTGASIRSQKVPPSGERFKKLLADDGDEEKGRGKESPISMSAGEKSASFPKADQRIFEHLVEKAKGETTGTTVDASNNQIPSQKESKVPPPLGKEVPTAPAEEPRSQPYVAKEAPEIRQEKGFKRSERPQELPMERNKLNPKPETVAMSQEGNVKDAVKGQMKSTGVSENAIQEAATPQAAEEASKTATQQLSQLSKNERLQSRGNESMPSRSTKDKKEDKSQAIPSSERQDIAGTNFAAAGKDLADIASVSEHAPQRSDAAARKEVVEIANQIVDKMMTVTTPDRVEVIITLKNLPDFEGATVKVVTDKQAPGQFNVEFYDLKPQAKAILDKTENRLLLQERLDNSGYVMQMMTTSTYAEPSSFVASDNRRGSGGGGESGNSERDEQEEQKEEEK